MGLHDRSYRLLFSEPRLIEDLIRGFFPDPWVDPEADQFRPRLKCRLIDESRYSLEDLAARQNLVAVLFWLEKTTDPADVQRGIARLVERLGDDPAANSLRRAFAVWLNVVRLPGTGLTEEEIPEILGLEDFKNMMEQQVDRWNRVLLDKGRQEGLQAGRQEGLQEGLRAGEARLVLQQLEEKFGVLDTQSRERIQTADADQLLEWGARLMKAHRLRDVFGD